jgi:hypothetical protein
MTAVRFEPKSNHWMVAFLSVLLLVACAFLLFRAFAQGFHQSNLIPLLALLPGVHVAARFLFTLPPRYLEIREDGLLLCRGWKKDLVPYSSLISIQPLGSELRIVTRDRKKFSMYELADEAGFKAEIAQRCPHLSPRRFGLESMVS